MQKNDPPKVPKWTLWDNLFLYYQESPLTAAYAAARRLNYWHYNIVILVCQSFLENFSEKQIRCKETSLLLPCRGLRMREASAPADPRTGPPRGTASPLSCSACLSFMLRTFVYLTFEIGVFSFRLVGSLLRISHGPDRLQAPFLAPAFFATDYGGRCPTPMPPPCWGSPFLKLSPSNPATPATLG